MRTTLAASRWGYILYAVLASAVLFLVWAEHVYAFPIPCQQILSYYGEVPQGFAKPYDVTVTSSLKPMLVSAECENGWAKLYAGTGNNNAYVYEQGYEWDGNTWKPFTFTAGGQKNGPWFLGTATIERQRTPDALELPTYFVAYVCQWNGSKWNCGCQDTQCNVPAWNLQAYGQSKLVKLPPGPMSKYIDVLIRSVQPDTVNPGGLVKVIGYGFQNGVGNTVTLVNVFDRSKTYTITNTNGSFGAEIALTIPANTPTGVYDVYVKNATGETEMPKKLAIATLGALPPVVTGVTPTSGKYMQSVTIQGRNFLPEHNIVFAPYGEILDLSSTDGTSLTFQLKPFPDIPETSKMFSNETRTEKITLPWIMHFNVMNQNGDTFESTSGNRNPTAFEFHY